MATKEQCTFCADWNVSIAQSIRIKEAANAEIASMHDFDMSFLEMVA